MKMGLLLFMLLPLAALVYVLWHVYQLLPLPTWGKWLVVVLMTMAFGMLFVGVSRRLDEMPMTLATIVYEIGTSSLIILLYLFMLFLVLDLGRLCHLVPGTLMKNSLWGSLLVFGIILVTFIYGGLHYHHKEREEIELTKDEIRNTKEVLTERKDTKTQRIDYDHDDDYDLKEGQNTKTKTIVMMSDLHLGYHNQRPELHRWVEMINAENPDLILIAGDIIDRSVRPLEEQKMWEEFRQLKAPVVACLGNHEYYAGQPNSLSFYEKAGIRLLRDEILLMDDLAIVGRDDRTNPHRKSVKALTANIDHSKYIILLDHQPYHLERTEAAGVDFQLSGHTHYGQVWPISWITKSIYECAYGPHQRGNTHYYVSSGIGIWGGKFRIGTNSEYVVATLKPHFLPRKASNPRP